MSPTSWGFAGATAALVVAFILGIPRPQRSGPIHPALIGAALIFLTSLAVRALFVEPTLVHADVAAPLLVDCALQFPLPCTNRGASYGQYGHWLLGAMAVPFGRDLDAVFTAMQIVGALNVALLATLAYRLSGSAYGALFTVAVTATNPIFMRVAASEDMHNIGLLLGLIAFLAMDFFARTRRVLLLFAVVLALGLMIHARQTFHLFAPCVFLLGLARGGASILRSRAYWIAGLMVLAVLLQRAIASDSANLGQQMATILSQPILAPTILRYHGLFDVIRFGPLALLTLAAIVWACLAGGVARVVALIFGMNFIVTYPCGMASPGVEFAQRISVFALAMLLCGMAGAAFVERRVVRERQLATGMGIAFLLSVIPPLFPGWQTLSELTPIHREYLAVETAAESLPTEFWQVTLVPTDTNSYGGSRYKGLLERTGRVVHTVPVGEIDGKPRPWIFLENIECWTYSFPEVAGGGDGGDQPREQRYRWDLVIFGRQRSTIRPPAEVRPQCDPILRDSLPLGPEQLLANVEDDAPFLFYSTSTVPVRFHEVSALLPQPGRGAS